MKKFLGAAIGICAFVGTYAQNNNVPVDSATSKNNEGYIFRPRHVNMNSPLFIVDKKEITNEELEKIKPDDIASINVLKDSASTYMYGERGRHGVILIELKDNRKMNLRKPSSD